jgi:TRAP-type C4-dicarboxylate transport system, small permease component
MQNTTFYQIYDKLLQYIIFIMMVGLSVTVVVGVSYRWAGQSLVWYDEVAAIQLAWLTYYGAAYASLKGAHIGVPSMIKAFPPTIRQYLFFYLNSNLCFLRVTCLLWNHSHYCYSRRNLNNFRMGVAIICAISDPGVRCSYSYLGDTLSKNRLCQCHGG